MASKGGRDKIKAGVHADTGRFYTTTTKKTAPDKMSIMKFTPKARDRRIQSQLLVIQPGFSAETARREPGGFCARPATAGGR